MLEKTAGQESPFIFSLRSQSRELFYKSRLHISTVIHACTTICRIKDFRKFSVYGHHLRSSQPFRQHKPKFSEYILNLWSPVTFSGSLSYSQLPLFPLQVSTWRWLRLCWGCSWIRPRRWFMWRAEFSFSWISAIVFLLCWLVIGEAQGREKRARERSISLQCIKTRCNISFHSCYQSISYHPPGYSCSAIPRCSKKILTTSKSFLSCSVIITGLKNIPGCQSKWRHVFSWW